MFFGSITQRHRKSFRCASIEDECHKGKGKRGHIVADTLLPAQMFPRLPPRPHLLRTGHKKCFWFCSETFSVRNKCFPVCAAWKHNIHFVSRAFARPRNIMSNNVSSFARALSGTNILPYPKRYDEHAHPFSALWKLPSPLGKSSVEFAPTTRQDRLVTDLVDELILEVDLLS